MESINNTALLERPEVQMELSTGDGDNNEGEHELSPDGDIAYTHMINHEPGGKSFKVFMIEARAEGTELTAICNEPFVPGRIEMDHPTCLEKLVAVSNSRLDRLYWVE